MSLKENIEIKKTEMLLEAMTFEDLKKIAATFKKIESITSDINLPEIDKALEIARSDLAMLNSQDYKKGVKYLGQRTLELIGQSREAKIRRQTVGRLIAIQTMLIKLLRELPTIMTMVSKTIPKESIDKNGNIISEDISAIDLSKKLRLQFPELQKKANELAGKKIIKAPNDNVPEEIEAGIKQSVANKMMSDTSREDKSAEEKKNATPQQNQANVKKPLGAILGQDASQRFIDYVVKSLDINKGFMSKILGAIGFGEDQEKYPNPEQIAKDLLNLTMDDFNRFVEQSKSSQNMQVGLTQQDAREFAATTKADASNRDRQGATGSHAGIGVEKITPKQLYQQWSEEFPKINQNTLKRMIYGLKGKTITTR